MTTNTNNMTLFTTYTSLDKQLTNTQWNRPVSRVPEIGVRDELVEYLAALEANGIDDLMGERPQDSSKNDDMYPLVSEARSLIEDERLRRMFADCAREYDDMHITTSVNCVVKKVIPPKRSSVPIFCINPTDPFFRRNSGMVPVGEQEKREEELQGRAVVPDETIATSREQSYVACSLAPQERCSIVVERLSNIKTLKYEGENDIDVDLTWKGLPPGATEEEVVMHGVSADNMCAVDATLIIEHMLAFANTGKSREELCDEFSDLYGAVPINAENHRKGFIAAVQFQGRVYHVGPVKRKKELQRAFIEQLLVENGRHSGELRGEIEIIANAVASSRNDVLSSSTLMGDPCLIVSRLGLKRVYFTEYKDKCRAETDLYNQYMVDKMGWEMNLPIVHQLLRWLRGIKQPSPQEQYRKCRSLARTSGDVRIPYGEYTIRGVNLRMVLETRTDYSGFCASGSRSLKALVDWCCMLYGCDHAGLLIKKMFDVPVYFTNPRSIGFVGVHGGVADRVSDESIMAILSGGRKRLSQIMTRLCEIYEMVDARELLVRLHGCPKWCVSYDVSKEITWYMTASPGARM